ncbi:MAG: hypothetical protein KTR35_06500 [Gammaproteobacteria bacterium]|nr:hypothetical protein [Gammaproteobacteria bacterium]
MTDDQPLYAHEEFKVTPTWLVVDHASYAIRYISKLNLKKMEPPRLSAYGVIAIVFVIGLFTLFQMVREVWPFQWAWWGLAACAVTAIYALYIALLIPDKIILYVAFNSGETLELTHQSPSVVIELHKALHSAMVIHDNEPIKVERYDSMSIE